MHFKTRAIHAGQPPDPAYGAVTPPVHQTSTFAFRGVNEPGPFDYSRSGNPTRKALEDCLASLEGAHQGFVFATGMAAESTILLAYGPGDHLIIHDDLYGGTYRLLTEVVAKKGVEVEFVNLRELDKVEAAIRPETRLIWIETPTNPLMNIVDLAGVQAIAKQHGVMTLCDNTFLSPYFQRPHEFGVDLVLHSTTKYINGHADVVGGAITARDQATAEYVEHLTHCIGAIAGPQDCFLVLRGLKTLALRMEEHNRNALAIARWLEAHPKVAVVLHPGLESHPQHGLAKRQMSGYGGTFAFRMKGGEAEAFRLLSAVKLFILAESLGGVQSLIEHPWTMTHVSMPEEAREKMTITSDLIRISVGIEDCDDLIADLDQALAQV